jgi:hypothetical protein
MPTALTRSSALPVNREAVGGEAVRGLVMQSPQGCQPQWFICPSGRNLGLRTRSLWQGTLNKMDTASLYWFGPPESKILCLVLDCIDVDDLGELDLGGSALPALCWLTDKVDGPRVQVSYNRETNLRKVTT